MDRRRSLMSISESGEKVVNTITLSFSFTEHGMLPDGNWGLNHYYNVRALEPVTSDIVLRDSVYPDSLSYFGGTLYAGNTSNSMTFSKQLTSSDDVILSPTEDNTYIYEVTINV